MTITSMILQKRNVKYKENHIDENKLTLQGVESDFLSDENPGKTLSPDVAQMVPAGTGFRYRPPRYFLLMT